jgi:tetraacyldisaccharide 4'-kinase
MGVLKDIILFPLSLIYGLITGVRNFLYNTGILPSVEFPFPVICVGNITVGGTGKTPHTEHLIDLLDKEFSVAVLSRGYRRKSNGFMIVDSESSVSDTGDEPLQMARKFPGVLVAVDRKRVHGVKKIMELRPDIQVIILDDAFQHRSIKPGLSILLSDYERLFVRDHIMPYGRLRESRENMRRADIILITKSPGNISPIQKRLIIKEVDNAPYQNLYFTSISYLAPVPLFDNRSDKILFPEFPDLSSSGIVLVTGIANPIPLKEYLGRINSAELVHLSFTDHHNYTEKDIITISSAYQGLKTNTKYIFTTEKDAMRLRKFRNMPESPGAAFFYIPMQIKFLDDDANEFDKLIIDYVRKNKPHNRISQERRDDRS